MRKIVIAMLWIIPASVCSQSIKIQAGATISKLNYDIRGTKYYTDTYVGYYAGVGVDYLQKSRFNLSSTFGVITKGGNNIKPANASASMTFLTFSTCIEWNIIKKKKFSPFISVGPKADYFLDSKQIGGIKDKPTIDQMALGMLFGAGVKQTRKKITGAVRVEYYANMKNIDHVNDRTFLISAQLSFRLKKS